MTNNINSPTFSVYNTNFETTSAVTGVGSPSYESDQLFSILSELLVYTNGAGDNTGGLNFANPTDPNSAWEIQQLAGALKSLDAYYTANPPTNQYDAALLTDLTTSYQGTTLATLLATPSSPATISTLQSWLADSSSPLYKLVHTDLMAQINNSSFNYQPTDGSAHSVPISNDPSKSTCFTKTWNDYTTAMSAANNLYNLAVENKETDPTKGYLNAYLTTVANAMQELDTYFAQFPSSDNLGYTQIINSAFNSPLESGKGVIGNTTLASLLSEVTSGTATSAQLTAFLGAVLPSGNPINPNGFGNNMGNIINDLVYTIENARNFTQPFTKG